MSAGQDIWDSEAAATLRAAAENAQPAPPPPYEPYDPTGRPPIDWMAINREFS